MKRVLFIMLLFILVVTACTTLSDTVEKEKILGKREIQISNSEDEDKLVDKTEYKYHKDLLDVRELNVNTSIKDKQKDKPKDDEKNKSKEIIKETKVDKNAKEEFNDLKIGSECEKVKQVQGYLNKFGFKLSIDGSFGPMTQKALKHFQKKLGLKQTGIVDKETLDKLKNHKEENLASDFNKVNNNNYEDGFYEYKSDTLSIKVEPLNKNGVRYWVSTVKVKSMDQVKVGFAGNNEFSTSVKEPTSVIAKRHGAVLAINGAASGFNSSGFVVRDGNIYRDTIRKMAPLEFRNDGTLFIGERGRRNAQTMVSEGALHVLDFGPGLISNGILHKDRNNGSFNRKYAPRTAIGQKTPFEYIIITADGRSSVSRGMNYRELLVEFNNRGAKWAYNLDGGGSTTLYYKNKVLNNPSDGAERYISDILYFTD